MGVVAWDLYLQIQHKYLILNYYELISCKPAQYTFYQIIYRHDNELLENTFLNNSKNKLVHLIY